MTTTKARPGRPRNDETRARILDTALRMLRESGYAALTVDGIAAAVGCGKQTIYRWWPGKAEVVLDALAELARDQVGAGATGDPVIDLQRFVRRTVRAI